jgi:hypothetical protein
MIEKMQAYSIRCQFFSEHFVHVAQTRTGVPEGRLKDEREATTSW